MRGSSTDRLGWLVTLAAFLMPAGMTAQTGDATTATTQGVVITVSPQNVIRNSVVTVMVKDGPSNPKTVKIDLDGQQFDAQTISPGVYQAVIPDPAGSDKPTVVPLGKHRVSVLLDNRWFTSEQTLTVERGAPSPALTGISPTNIVRHSRKRSLTLSGNHFAVTPASDNQIVMDGVPLPIAWDGCDDQDKWKTNERRLTHGSVDESGSSISLCNVNLPDKSSVEVTVRHGVHETSGLRITISPWSRLTIVGLAVLVVLGCCGLVMLLIWTVRKYRIGDTAYGVLSILFLDPETDTYSLSKLQFYMWTGAAIFAYAYFVICRLFVQRSIFPDVPSSLPGIIAIGAGTAIGSQLVTSVRGPKGGGPERPSLADFVTSGGVAAADRIQMLLWTLVGVAGFCIATVKTAPWTIRELPEIGNNLMLLMGISSAGYLGGKLARKPGPVLNEISTSPSGPDDNQGNAPAAAAADFTPPRIRVIELRGRNLSKDGIFEINGVELPFRMLAPVNGVQAPEMMAHEDDASLVNMARALRLTIRLDTLGASDRATYDSWFGTGGKTLKFTVSNPDGQMSDLSFTLPPGAQQAHG